MNADLATFMEENREEDSEEDDDEDDEGSSIEAESKGKQEE